MTTMPAPPGGRARVSLAAIAGAVIAGAAGALLLLAPEAGPDCLFRTFLGTPCPGCGSSRALAALVRGDFGLAFRLQPMLVVGLPVAGVLGLGRRIVLSA